MKAIGLLIISSKTRCYACVNQKPVTDIDAFEFVKNLKKNETNTLNRSVNVVAGSLAVLEAMKYLMDFENIQL